MPKPYNWGPEDRFSFGGYIPPSTSMNPDAKVPNETPQPNMWLLAARVSLLEAQVARARTTMLFVLIEQVIILTLVIALLYQVFGK